MIIEWNQSLSVKNPLLDEQHKILISLIQSLHNNHDTPNISICLDQLIDYAGYHFTDEESFMLSINYKDLDNHKKSHQKFISKISALTKDFDKGNLIIDSLSSFLVDWLINHIKHIDSMYIPKP